MLKILCIIGPTASGKSSRAVEEALARGGEVISVDSRQVYRGLDIGTEKVSREEMRGVPHHLIDIRELEERYSAGDFVQDATRLVEEISARGKLPILAGGTHYYFDALLRGVPPVSPNEELRKKLEKFSNEELFKKIKEADPKRAGELDPANRRRLIRALEIIETHGSIPPRPVPTASFPTRLNLDIEWLVIDPPREELRARIDARLKSAFERGLVDEVRRIRELVGDKRLNEFGLEYRVVGEYLSSFAEATEDEARRKLLPILSAKLWQFARHQKAWLRKLIPAASSHPDRS